MPEGHHLFEAESVTLVVEVVRKSADETVAEDATV
jgi:hypothetical protein